MALLRKLLLDIEAIIMIRGAKYLMSILEEELGSVVLKHKSVQISMIDSVLLAILLE